MANVAEEKKAAGELAKVGEKFLKLMHKYDLISVWKEATDEELAKDPFQFHDEQFLSKLLPLMEILCKYFDAEVRGFENVPAKGPMLLVGNHSGGALTPDTSAFYTAWYRNRGLEDQLVGLAFDSAFSIPKFGMLMRKIGQVPASQGNAEKALSRGKALLVYPGGVHEVYRPWTERNKIDFDNRKGFIKLALKSQVPVVPIVGHGGHSTTIVLGRGEGLAKAMGYERLRMKINPILLQFPWGISSPLFLGMPYPAKITTQILPPFDWTRYGPEGANDPAVLQACYDEITGAMQKTLTSLAEENPWPVLTRIKSLLPGGKKAVR